MFYSGTGALDTTASNITIYGWDNANELVSVKTYATYSAYAESATPSCELDYAYDAFDMKVSRTTKDSTGAITTNENYTNDGQNLALVLNSAGAVIERELYGPAVDQVFASEVVGSNAYVSGGFTSTTQAAGTTNWFFTDNQGSVRDVIQATVVSGGTSDAYVVATDVDNINYDPFGNIIYQSAPTAQPRFGYNGTQYDAATGMNYMTRRWYDPVNGNWLSQDPIGFAGGQTNTSEFVGNSPTNYTDPSGEDWLDNGANFFAGWGDTLTLGGTSAVRRGLGIDGGIQYNSGFYRGGQVVGAANQIALGFGAPGALGAAGTIARGYGTVTTVWGVGTATTHIVNGNANWTDALAFLPFAGWGLRKILSVPAVGKLFNAGASGGGTPVFQLWSKFKCWIPGFSCFVAGTLVLVPDDPAQACTSVAFASPPEPTGDNDLFLAVGFALAGITIYRQESKQAKRDRRRRLRALASQFGKMDNEDIYDIPNDGADEGPKELMRWRDPVDIVMADDSYDEREEELCDVIALSRQSSGHTQAKRTIDRSALPRSHVDFALQLEDARPSLCSGNNVPQRSSLTSSEAKRPH
jgi:RHS repeat-associated protein